MNVRSADEVKRDFARKGVSPRSWALANGIKPFVVYQLLAGVSRGVRGQSHNAAVLLGLKEGEIVPPDQIKSAIAVSQPSRTTSLETLP